MKIMMSNIMLKNAEESRNYRLGREIEKAPCFQGAFYKIVI